MQLINPSYEILHQYSDSAEDYGTGRLLADLYIHIERCGRTCYKSLDKVTPGSAKPFVDRMVASQHYAMLEHGTVYLTLPYDAVGAGLHYHHNKYSKVVWPAGPILYVTTNLRVIAENNWWDDLEYIVYPTKYHCKRITTKFVCNRQVSHEFVRHRVFSFAQESTRYCNYSKDKFSRELTFIIPNWCKYIDEGEAYYHDGICYRTGASAENPMGTRSWTRPLNDKEDAEEWDVERSLLNLWDRTEREYLYMVEHGWKAQQAATILPNSIKTELIMTGFSEDWEHFFDLRSLGVTGAPHPQASELAKPLHKEFIDLGYVRDFTASREQSQCN